MNDNKTLTAKKTMNNVYRAVTMAATLSKFNECSTAPSGISVRPSQHTVRNQSHDTQLKSTPKEFVL